MEFSIEIHRSLRSPEDEMIFQTSLTDNESRTYMEVINELLESVKHIQDEVILNGDAKPGILFISDRTELNSLGILTEQVDTSEDVHIKIVPILHGG